MTENPAENPLRPGVTIHIHMPAAVHSLFIEKVHPDGRVECRVVDTPEEVINPRLTDGVEYPFC